MPPDKDGEFTITAAGPEAQAAIRAMIRAGRLNPLGLDWRRFLLARDGQGAIAGCVQVKPHRDGSRELASLYVLPSLRGAGAGSRLVSAILEREQRDLWLTCRAGLAAYYRRFGFRTVENAAAMPTYFRRVWRIFNLPPGNSRLSVMVRERDQSTSSHH